MAGGAVVNDASMVKYCGGKAAGHVTNSAILGCRKMVSILTCRSHTIMTIVTSLIQNFGTGVIDIGVSEASGVMAYPTILGGVGMRWRSSLTSGANRLKTAIVTGLTIAINTGVIKIGCGYEP